MKVIMSLFLLIVPFKLNEIPAELTIVDDEEVIMTINRNEYLLNYLEEPFINQTKLKQLFATLNDDIYQQPIDAKLDETGNIIEERPGFILDELSLYRSFLQYFYMGYPRTITIPKTKLYPRVDSELLAEIRENRLNGYMTHYNASNKERSHNIYLSSQAINNHVVFPGGEFSFNKVVGERTAERGYMKAPVIVRGEFSEDIGGGICQVSSTLYNAVDLKGIQIMERYSHSRSVPYVPPGKDATVSWWGPDFVFKNNYNQPILIRSHAKNGVLSIQIYSAEDVS